MLHKLDQHGPKYSLNDQKLWNSKVDVPVRSNSDWRRIVSLLALN